MCNMCIIEIAYTRAINPINDYSKYHTNLAKKKKIVFCSILQACQYIINTLKESKQHTVSSPKANFLIPKKMHFEAPVV